MTDSAIRLSLKPACRKLDTFRGRVSEGLAIGIESRVSGIHHLRLVEAGQTAHRQLGRRGHHGFASWTRGPTHPS